MPRLTARSEQVCNCSPSGVRGPRRRTDKSLWPAPHGRGTRLGLVLVGESREHTGTQGMFHSCSLLPQHGVSS